MKLEQSTNNVPEKIITNESVEEVVPIEVISEEDKQAKVEEKLQKEKENNDEIAKKREEIMNQMGEQESKEGYQEGHIMNPNMLDKVAQLEAIDWDTLEFSQKRYDNYFSSNFASVIEKNQKKLQSRIDLGKKPYYDETDTIMGLSGLNRYVVRENGILELARGGLLESGNQEYKEKLYKKAKELGITVQGQ